MHQINEFAHPFLIVAHPALRHRIRSDMWLVEVPQRAERDCLVEIEGGIPLDKAHIVGRVGDAKHRVVPVESGGMRSVSFEFDGNKTFMPVWKVQVQRLTE